jgi:uncharacterized protein (TIGR00369 family)
MLDDYRPHTRRSPFTAPWEPILSRETGGVTQLALSIRDVHCNSRGLAHGGLIVSLADNAMGLSALNVARRQPGTQDANAVTVALSVDFIDVARIGDLVEFQPAILKIGRTLAFVECRVICGSRLIARASATFRLL